MKDAKPLILTSALILLLMFIKPSKADAAAVAEVSYLGRDNLPRGIRNNNPGNIEFNPNNRWQGAVNPAQRTDDRFEQFTAYWYGVRAMIKLIKNYINNYNRNTIRKIISVYAPTSENNTAAYVNAVASASGIHPDAPITGTYDELSRIIPAMAIHENGHGENWIDPLMFQYAWSQV